MPIPMGGVPPRAVSWVLYAVAALFALVAVLRILDRSPWLIVVISAALAVATAGAAKLIQSKRPDEGPALKPRKLAGPGT